MPVSSGGFIHWRKERYLIAEAIASWDGKSLSVCGRSDECGVYFCGIPFGPASGLTDIKGRSYSGEGTTPFSEGRAMVAGQVSYMEAGTVNCIGVSPECDSIAIEFEIEVVLDESGRKRKMTGGMRCRIVATIPFEMTKFEEG